MTPEQLRAIRERLTWLEENGGIGLPFVEAHVLLDEAHVLLAEVERLTAERDDAFRRGFNAMRELANERLEAMDYLSAAREVRTIPFVEDK